MGAFLLILISILILFLIFLSACFSFSEIALASTSKIRLKIFERKGSPKEKRQAKRVLGFIENYNQFSNTIIIFNNIINILATSISATFFSIIFTDQQVLAVMMTFLVMTFLVILFGELIPKMLAKKYPEKGIMFFSFTLVFLSKTLVPVNYALKFIMQQSDLSPIKNEEELKEAISQAEQVGVTSKQEQKIIDAALKFDDTLARDIMIHKENVEFLYEDNSQDEILKKLISRDHTRVPVLNYENKVIYILNAKKYLFDYFEDRNVKKQEHLYPFQTFLSNTPIQKILNSLKAKREKLAIIVNSNNRFIGILTIEDIIEVLVGKIYDEFDIEKDGVYVMDDKSFLVRPNVKTKYFFKKYLHNIKGPLNLPKKSSFIDWVRFLAKSNDINVGDHFFYKNLIIWVKKDNYNQKNIIFEIDIL